jgi:formylglycine-generating enzyme required for sulfatase activity
MKRTLGIAMVVGLVGALTVMAQEVKPGKTEIINLGGGVKLEMVLIPAGKFMMGSPASEKGRDDDETQHEVTLTKPFYMGKYEVTQEQWLAIVVQNPSRIRGRKLPVTNVEWDDCQWFIKRLNAQTTLTKSGYRLPTEAEWEYACRAGTTTRYSFGDKITTKDANYRDANFLINSKIGEPVAVGSYNSNAFGLHDMHGNVCEWCKDWKSDYLAGAVTDPKGPEIGRFRVLRGGSFGYGELANSSSSRYGGIPYSIRSNDGRLDYNGFRLVRNP